MTALEIQIGSTITNGSSCIRVTERIERHPRWKCPAWRGLNIPLEEFGSNPGTTSDVPDYLLTGWYHLPFEWRAVFGGALEERYVWDKDMMRLQREVRRALPAAKDRTGIRDHLPASPEEDEARVQAAMKLTDLSPIPGINWDEADEMAEELTPVTRFPGWTYYGWPDE